MEHKSEVVQQLPDLKRQAEWSNGCNMQSARQTEEPFFSGYQWCVEKAAYPRGRKKRPGDGGNCPDPIEKNKRLKGPEPRVTDATTVKT